MSVPIIACVLKSGGIYDWQYVQILHRLCKELFPTHIFICFTDLKVRSKIKTRKLMYNLPGWWSKLEIFRIKRQPVFYIDLDTILLKNFAMPKWNSDCFYMLAPFKQDVDRLLSGVMFFNGDYSFLLTEFMKKHKFIYKRWGDQAYIKKKLEKHNKQIQIVNNFVNVQSYKWQCIDGPKDDTNIVCFHGKPRPHEVEKGWITEIWKIK